MTKEEQDPFVEFFKAIDAIKDSKTNKKKERCDWPGCKNLALITIQSETVDGKPVADTKRQTCKKHLRLWFQLNTPES